MGGTPPPPFTDKIFGKKGVRVWGGPPPPFTDKIRKVVFEVLPYQPGNTEVRFSENFGLHLDELNQFRAITTQTISFPERRRTKTEKLKFRKIGVF